MPSQPPLTLLVQLTEEQRRQIFEQTGRMIDAVPVASRAASIETHFGGISLRVARGVFVPAVVTEHLLQRALAAAQHYGRPTIAEVGTGCGAVALALARKRIDAFIHATDISDVALRCAR